MNGCRQICDLHHFLARKTANVNRIDPNGLNVLRSLNPEARGNAPNAATSAMGELFHRLKARRAGMRIRFNGCLPFTVDKFRDRGQRR